MLANNFTLMYFLQQSCKLFLLKNIMKLVNSCKKKTLYKDIYYTLYGYVWQKTAVGNSKKRSFR